MTYDLTQITSAFGLLDDEVQNKLCSAHTNHAQIQLYNDEGKWVNCWPAWLKDRTYRVQPAPKTKPSINWDHVHPDYKWLARDEDGEATLFAAKPNIDSVEYFWWAERTCYLGADVFASFNPGTCDWADSLVERPNAQ